MRSRKGEMKAVVLLSVLLVVVGSIACASESFLDDCECTQRYKKCQRYMTLRHKEDRCREGFDLCLKCPTKKCHQDMDVCIKRAKVHDDYSHVNDEFEKCISTWYSCAKASCVSPKVECNCTCRYQQCQKYMASHHKQDQCRKGFDLCKKCPTKKCDIEMDICIQKAKVHDDFSDVDAAFYRCIETYYICADKNCKSNVFH